MESDRIDGFVIAFDASYRERLNAAERKAGRALKEHERRQVRREVREAMRSQGEWGDVLRYVDAYTQAVSERFTAESPRKGLPKMNTLDEVARIGAEIENRLRGLSISANALTRGVASSTVTARKSDATSRYKELVNSLSVAPSDLVAAKLLGVTAPMVATIRANLSKMGYKFKASVSENGVPTQWEVEAPSPRAAEPTLKELVDGLGDDDKRTLYELLRGIKR